MFSSRRIWPLLAVAMVFLPGLAQGVTGDDLVAALAGR